MKEMIDEYRESNLSNKLKLVSISNIFVGQDEIRGNKGFKNKFFEKEMRDTGWQTGWAWCASFVEMVFDLTFPELETKLEKLFSPGVTKTRDNFLRAGYTVSMKPSVGDIMIMQRDGSWKGHAGIVVGVEGDIIYTVEGNTNDSGSREGYTVARKERNYKDTSRSMDVVGFIKVI